MQPIHDVSLHAPAVLLIGAITIVADPSRGVAPDHTVPRVAVVTLDDTIQPASLRYVERALDQAAADQADLVIIELDTPGGLLESLRAMSSAILASEVPVAVYVTPSGARAASAGFFLLLAADIAAMAPGTNTGAAHPVTIGGGGGGGGEDAGRNASIDKAVEDASALARSLAERRKRSVTAARQAVHESRSFTADEARAVGLIEVMADDRASLLEQLDGRTITRFAGHTQRLTLGGAEVLEIERTFAERVLSVLASPQVAYLLLMIGMLLVFVELTSPGLVVPGVAGAISFLLGLYGFSVLPVNLIGALLIAAGIALLVAEVFITSYGALAVAGIASFVAGSLMLVDARLPELQIGLDVVVPVAAALVLVSAFLAFRAARTRHVRARSGVEAMIGEHGQVVAALAPAHEGKVFVHGEYWTATSEEPLAAGRKVRVDAVDGLRLRVSAVDQLTTGEVP